MLRTAVVRSLLLCLLWRISALKPQCTRDGFNLIKTIGNQTPDWGSGTMLYTPSTEQFQKCRRATLKCLEEEMKMLLNEWNLNKTAVKRILKVLRTQSLSFKQQEKDCVQCEHFEEKPAQHFLDFVNTTLQMINSSC